jgi:hypothetical protein
MVAMMVSIAVPQTKVTMGTFCAFVGPGLPASIGIPVTSRSQPYAVAAPAPTIVAIAPGRQTVRRLGVDACVRSSWCGRVYRIRLCPAAGRHLEESDEVAVSVFDRCDQVPTTNIIDLLVLFANRGEDCSGS